jgi:serine/threonine protein kinase/tetratricopeptide (TPR) repeat protein
MQPEHRQDCLDIFSDAIDLPLNARAAFLERTCNGDQALRREVELLLKHHDESGDFIDTPAFVAAPELLIDDPHTLIGQCLGRYRIDALLGAGGMGVVYLASDLELGRMVGLKLLPQSLLPDRKRWELFKQEARTASALNHPNIMTIHEVGEINSTHYIATEFIEGSTLRERISRGPIPPAEALEIVTQIAHALSVAHKAGIVHRDIKPENIMLRPDGYVKVLDFGIAKFAVAGERFGVEIINGTGLTIFLGNARGTARYMSPEQARNEPVDRRSDLWSLGVVLYEMLTAHPPFEGDTPTDVMAAVVASEPRPVSVRVSGIPDELQQVAGRSLKKDPNDRYQTADELLSDLRQLKEKSFGSATTHTSDKQRPREVLWLGIAAAIALVVSVDVYVSRTREAIPASTPSSIEKGIAVLPFENLSAEKSDAFLADSVQDDVLTSIGKIKNLKVIARTSVMEYGSGPRQPGKIREIGRALGISHVLEGSVRKIADRLVINVALIDAHDERRVWSDRYERTLDDTTSLQGELAVGIARELHATLTPAEATFASTKPTQNPQAYLLYLRAREIDIANVGGDAELPAIKLYQQAIDLDPSFALARARLSLCASQVYYSDAPDAWKARARAEAEEALRLRPDLGEAHLALTHCYLWADKNYDLALAELSRTAELLPNSPEVPVTAAYIYKRQNRLRDRIAALLRAETLDPRNIRALQLLTNTLRWVRDWPEAMQSFDQYQAIVPREGLCSWHGRRAHDEFQLSGDISVLKNFVTREAEARPLESRDALNFTQYEIAMFERNYAEAARFLGAVPAESLRDRSREAGGHSKVFHEAVLAVASNAVSKQQTLERARAETESRVADNDPKADRPESDLAVLYAFLGRKEDAIRQAERARDIWATRSTERNDAYAALAMVYAQTGEAEKAIELIEHLLTVPSDLQHEAVYNMTLVDLKWRWEWDPLRNHPRFQKIVNSAEPKTIY